jgi:predicted PurR-regulated permease PerM
MKTGWDLKVMIGLIAAVAVFGALYSASKIFAPLTLGLYIIAIVWPLQRWLTTRLPTLLALAITILLTAAVVLLFASLIVWGFGRVGRSVIADAARYQAIYDQAAAWLDGRGISLVGLWAEHFNMSWLMGAARQVHGLLYATLSFCLITLVYVVLGLLEVEDMHRKAQALGNRDVARILVDGTRATAAKFRKYMIVRTQMSFVTGLLVWGLATLSGLPLAAEWGVIAFVLNYIPFIGPFIATLFPALFAMAHFASWQAALGMFACLNVIQFIVGSYIEPRVAGIMLSLSPFVVLFSVFFWTYMWGTFGAFIGVPITIAIVTFCAQHPSSRWISDLIGGPGTPEKAPLAVPAHDQT